MVSRVLVRAPAVSDEPAFVAAARRSRALHRPWVTAPETTDEFLAYLGRVSEPEHRGFLIVRKDTGELAGVINISHMVMGRFRSGYLGYYAFAGHEGQGLMTEGLREVVRRAFNVLRLHRLEANIQPGNGPSRALVQRCGFALEGYSPRYLKIGGRWRDHERWARIAR